MPDKPFSAAAEENRDAIMPVLKVEFKDAKRILEIGSGTGQHAIYFSQHLPHAKWQPTDKEENLAGIRLWIEQAKPLNVCPPLELDVCKQWPASMYDAAFAANVAHIMHWYEIEAMFAGLSNLLTANAVFCLYGPFNVDGSYTSESNRRFDQWLQSRDPKSRIRDKDDLNNLAETYGLLTRNDWSMPANNRILSWIKT